jgi:NCS1 family nucleobase:cation symporter-1
VPLEKQTWTSGVFITYWYSDLITISTWGASSSILTTGLTATDAIIICMVAGFCNSIPTVLNGAIGADLHIPFPIAVRGSYGYWLSYFCVVSRGILALFWFGIHSTAGGKCMNQMLKAIWPSFGRIANTLPVWVGVSTQGMVSYLIYWLIQLPLLLIPTHKLQYMFWLKVVLVTPMALAMVIYMTVKAGGNGAFFYAPATVSGSTRAWLWLSNLTSVTGAYSTLAVNIPDFSRFSKSRGAQVWQLPVIPILKVIIGAFGILCASAAKEVYGKAYWNPLDIVNEWQGTAGGRAAAFFCAAIWLLASASVNISANAISFANDITSLVPKYVNIRRGVVIAAFFGGWALCPWIIMASAQSFLNFMSAYAIFMAPMAGIMCCDYWLVKKRRYDVPALYDPDGIYRYGRWRGVNWRALVSTAVTIVPLLPALAKKVTPQNVSIDKGLQNLFSFNWLYGFFLAFAMYWALNWAFPHKETLIANVVSGNSNAQHVDGVDLDVETGSFGAGDEKDSKEARSVVGVSAPHFEG